MQKLMKNWIFTLIVCILLAVLSVLMIVTGIRKGDGIGTELLHILAAVALIIYVGFALFPMAAHHRGVLQGFVIGEIIILLLTALAHILVNFDINIPLLATLPVCAVVGLALWLRGVVETVHAYLSNASTTEKNRIPLWRLLLYILLSAVGVWQMVRPLDDVILLFLVGGIAAVIAAIFGYITVVNHKESAPERAKRRAEKASKKEQANLSVVPAEKE